jgi:hypothetical protein
MRRGVADPGQVNPTSKSNEQAVRGEGAVVDHLTGPTVARLMAAHGTSIRHLATTMGVSMSRVREVRDHGVRGVVYVWDWAEGITGRPHITWATVAGLYAAGNHRRAMPRPKNAAIAATV